VSDVFLNDPAGRLYRFLEACLNTNTGMTVRNRWTDLFSLELPAPPAVFAANAATVMGLPTLVRNELSNRPNSLQYEEDYFESLDRADLALSLGTDASQPMAAMVQHYDAGDVIELKHASRLLQRDESRFFAADGQLKKIREASEDLLDAIRDARDLPADVRAALLDYASSALRDVDLYSVGGADALRKNVDSFRGQVIRDPVFVQEVGKHARLFGKLKTWSAAMAVVGAVIHAPLALMDDIGTYEALLGTPVTSLILAPGANAIEQGAPREALEQASPTPEADEAGEAPGN
jgi:hypothetical protein